MSEKRLERIMGWTFRLLLGALFIYSGFVKAVDPYGTLYKMSDYLGAMGVSILAPLLLVGVFLLCGFEFLIGVFFLLGCYRRATPVLAALFMAVMLPLTLWVAVADPVADCGCFGDAWIISNWMTFWKNVLIVAMLVWIWRVNPRLHWLVTPALQWIALLATGIFVIAIEWVGYYYQPLIDFRPYGIGEVLTSGKGGSEEPEYTFIFEKDGEMKEFRMDEEMPDEEDGWTFVERKAQAKEQTSGEKSGNDFAIFSTDGEEVTGDVYQTEGKQILVMMPNISECDISNSYKLNSLYDWSEEKGVDFLAIVNGSVDEIEEWRDLSMASYSIYVADDTAIEEVVRGNPAVVYLEDGKVVWKSTLKSIKTDDFLEGTPMESAKDLARDNGWILSRLSWGYCIIMLGLIAFSHLPLAVRSKKGTKRKKIAKN